MGPLWSRRCVTHISTLHQPSILLKVHLTDQAVFCGETMRLESPWCDNWLERFPFCNTHYRPLFAGLVYPVNGAATATTTGTCLKSFLGRRGTSKRRPNDVDLFSKGDVAVVACVYRCLLFLFAPKLYHPKWGGFQVSLLRLGFGLYYRKQAENIKSPRQVQSFLKKCLYFIG